MPVKFKAITPRAIKFDIAKATARNARRVKRGVESDYKKTVKTWDTKVKFEDDIKLSRDELNIKISTDNEVYRFVHDGTRAHNIKPVRAKVLRFQGVYSAKTTPGVIASKQGGASGPFIYRPFVRVSGIEARNFTKPILKKWRKQFEILMEEAINKAAQQSGHSMT